VMLSCKGQACCLCINRSSSALPLAGESDRALYLESDSDRFDRLKCETGCLHSLSS